MFKGTMTKLPVQKLTQGTTQKLLQHNDATDIVKFRGIMTKWPVQKLTHRTTQKHVQHHDAADI